MSDGSDSYEYAIRYTFNRCGRGGDPQGLGDADVFRGLQINGNHEAARRKVDQGLKAAAEVVLARLQAADWSEEDKKSGGLYNNAVLPLERAIRHLSGQHSQRNEIIISALIHALNACAVKLGSSVPDVYKGDD